MCSCVEDVNVVPVRGVTWVLMGMLSKGTFVDGFLVDCQLVFPGVALQWALGLVDIRGAAA